MTISLLDYTCKATVSLDRDRSQQVSVTISLRELPVPRSEAIPRWPDVYVASHVPDVYVASHSLDVQSLNEMGIPNSDTCPFEATLSGIIDSEIRISGNLSDLRVIGINIWNFEDNVSNDPITAHYMRSTAYRTSMIALLGVDVFACFNHNRKDRDERCGEFSLHEIEIRMIDNLVEQSSNLVNLRGLVRIEKEARSK